MVVIVDNDPDFCRTLADILTYRGFKVTQIVDPHTDVDQMTIDAQVILLDMNLNDLTGLDVLKDIRKRFPNLPVLLVTAYRQQMAPLIVAAQQIDAFACLYKPLEIPDLLQMLLEVQLKRLRGLFGRK
jgi:DNA-binding NtrC family response regulator